MTSTTDNLAEPAVRLADIRPRLIEEYPPSKYGEPLPLNSFAAADRYSLQEGVRLRRN